MSAADATQRARRAKSARRRAREYALQGLYQWLVAGGEPRAIAEQLAADEGFAKADAAFFRRLLEGAAAAAPELEAALAPSLDRKPAALSPVEHAVLLIGAYELMHLPEVPYRVAINEAVELAKDYGGTEGHKYVNGVLDKVAARLRPDEARRG
ncbi:MAG: transcription antitermination factor NusB [Burkholderiales bacterium]|nr:transcription antitermination factor NusB [Burkholderiales bacterium]